MASSINRGYSGEYLPTRSSSTLRGAGASVVKAGYSPSSLSTSYNASRSSTESHSKVASAAAPILVEELEGKGVDSAWEAFQEKQQQERLEYLSWGLIKQDEGMNEFIGNRFDIDRILIKKENGQTLTAPEKQLHAAYKLMSVRAKTYSGLVGERHMPDPSLGVKDMPREFLGWSES